MSETLQAATRQEHTAGQSAGRDSTQRVHARDALREALWRAEYDGKHGWPLERILPQQRGEIEGRVVSLLDLVDEAGLRLVRVVDATRAHADLVLRKRVFTLFAKLYGEEVESAPRVVRAIVQEHAALEMGESFAEIRGTVDGLLDLVRPGERERWAFDIASATELLDLWARGTDRPTLASAAAAVRLREVADQLAAPPPVPRQGDSAAWVVTPPTWADVFELDDLPF